MSLHVWAPPIEHSPLTSTDCEVALTVTVGDPENRKRVTSPSGIRTTSFEPTVMSLRSDQL